MAGVQRAAHLAPLPGSSPRLWLWKWGWEADENSGPGSLRVPPRRCRSPDAPVIEAAAPCPEGPRFRHITKLPGVARPGPEPSPAGSFHQQCGWKNYMPIKLPPRPHSSSRSLPLCRSQAWAFVNGNRMGRGCEDALGRTVYASHGHIHPRT